MVELTSFADEVTESDPGHVTGNVPVSSGSLSPDLGRDVEVWLPKKSGLGQ